MVLSIHRQDESKGVMGCTSFEVVGGSKRFMRVFDENPTDIQWGWVLHPTARLLWGEPE